VSVPERERPIYVPSIDPRDVVPPSREIYATMGEANIFRMIDDFYRELERSSLRPLFPSDMRAAAQRSAAFFVGLLGGPPLYHQRHGNPMMRARHMAFAVTLRGRDEWLACFDRVLAHAVERYAFPASDLEGFRSFLRDFSLWMVNTAPEDDSVNGSDDRRARPGPAER